MLKCEKVVSAVGKTLWWGYIVFALALVMSLLQSDGMSLGVGMFAFPALTYLAIYVPSVIIRSKLAVLFLLFSAVAIHMVMGREIMSSWGPIVPVAAGLLFIVFIGQVVYAFVSEARRAYKHGVGSKQWVADGPGEGYKTPQGGEMFHDEITNRIVRQLSGIEEKPIL